MFVYLGLYRRGARRWRKIYQFNGHSFVARRFGKVSEIHYHSANIYLFKVNNRNTRKRWEICSKEGSNKNISIVDFEQVNVR